MDAEELIAVWERDDSLDHEECSACEICDWMGDAVKAMKLYEKEADRLRHALLDTARRVESLKRECGMDPESPQAIRNSEYMSISLAARAALLPDNAAISGAQHPID